MKLENYSLSFFRVSLSYATCHIDKAYTASSPYGYGRELPVKFAARLLSVLGVMMVLGVCMLPAVEAYGSYNGIGLEVISAGCVSQTYLTYMKVTGEVTSQTVQELAKVNDR